MLLPSSPSSLMLGDILVEAEEMENATSSSSTPHSSTSACTCTEYHLELIIIIVIPSVCQIWAYVVLFHPQKL